MDLFDLIVYAALFVIGYLIGYLRMLWTLVSVLNDPGKLDAVMQPSEKEAAKIITIEKNNDQYFAYIDNNFITQHKEFGPLIGQIKRQLGSGTFVLSRASVDAFTDDEQDRLLAALDSANESGTVSQ